MDMSQPISNAAIFGTIGVIIVLIAISLGITSYYKKKQTKA